MFAKHLSVLIRRSSVSTTRRTSTASLLSSFTCAANSFIFQQFSFSTTTSTDGVDSNKDEQIRLLKTLGYRDLQRLAKLHEHIKGNQSKNDLVEQLSEVMPSSFLSSRTTKWLPKDAEVDTEATTTRGDVGGGALDWLAPDDVDVKNRRVMKNMAGTFDPDADRQLVKDQIQDENSNLENRMFDTTFQIVEGEPLSSDHIVSILAQNNARNIRQYRHVRTDAETYIIATGLSLRHVRSLKDALVYAAKKTKIPGLSSSSVAASGRKSPLAHWDIIDLRETVVHLLTEQGRELYDLETLWTVGLTEKDMEDLA
jgi:ribosomal silencing factor RsfS